MIQAALTRILDNSTGLPIVLWPTTGFAYPVLIGGLYAGQKPGRLSLGQTLAKR